MKKYPFDYIMYFDGACEPCNPDGNMGFGYVIYDNHNKCIKKHSSFVKAKKGNTNNIAEYEALILGLTYIYENLDEDKIIYIRGDSQLVVKQMNREWGIKSGAYVPYAKECLEIVDRFENINIDWIPREQNTIADNLSKNELLKHNVRIRY